MISALAWCRQKNMVIEHEHASLGMPQLFALARKNPLLVLDDIIHELNDCQLNTDFFLSIKGLKKSFSFTTSENIRTIENVQYTPELKKEIDSAIVQIAKRQERLAQEFSNLKAPAKDTAILEFIKKIIRLYTNQQEIILPEQHELSYKRKDIPECVEEFHKPSPKKDGLSVFSSSISKDPFLIIRNSCYQLQEKDCQDRDFVCLKQKNYAFSFNGPIELVEADYLERIDQHIRNRFNEELESIIQHLEQEKKRKVNLEKMLKYYSTNDVIGYLYDGSDYYIWVGVPTIEIRVNQKNYRFPSCRIGIRIFMNKDTVDFDRDPARMGGIRVLESKKVINGVEVGEMENMKNKNYMFPNTRFYGANRYCYACIDPVGTLVYNNYVPKKDGASINQLLQELLRTAQNRMRNGYIPGKCTVYTPITETNSAKYDNFMIRDKPKEGAK